jgi:putative intracellular protease/amidase/YHS domain-containing protein
MNSSSPQYPVALVTICLAFACFCGIGPARSSARADEKQKASGDTIALKGLDPVLLVDGKETNGKAEFAAESDGFRYLFATAANKTKFEKDPERYALQFHGQCAMMKEARAQPDLFAVYKGRIYGFGSEGCRDSFNEHPEKFALAEKAPARDRTVVVLVFKGMELLDFAGPVEVFTGAGFKVSTVAATSDSVPCFGVVTLTPHYTFADCPHADVIVVPGGSAGAVSRDKRVVEWLARASADADITLSVCTGAFVLAKAGLLDGKEATTHWSAIGSLRRQYPQITVRNDRRVVDTGKVVTSAGISAGIDGALHVVERLLGTAKATQTARNMEYIWQPTLDAKR